MMATVGSMLGFTIASNPMNGLDTTKFQVSKAQVSQAVVTRDQILGCANKDLWALCAPIFIIVVYCKTATSYFLGGKE